MVKDVSKNKILIGIGVLVVILVLAFAFFAFAQIDVALNVNSAFSVNQISTNQPVNGKFIITNVTVKNNGKDPVTISTDQFAPMINGKQVSKYSVFSGAGTDLQKQVKIPGGASKDFVVVFDIGSQTPDSLELSGPISWAPTYKNSAKIPNVSPTALFNGLNNTLNFSVKTNTTIYNMNVTSETNGTELNTVKKTADPNKMKIIDIANGTAVGSINGKRTIQKSIDNSTSTVDIRTGMDNNGTPAILPENMTKPGDSITTPNGIYTINGSEKIIL